jgi:hypothetical protein
MKKRQQKKENIIREIQFLPLVNEDLFYKKQIIKRLLRQLFSFSN